ncbi:hypothetical protein GCM10022225_65750 [Plantactinospora mayteni]|uniref:Uncharacterized protein n=1 Tax=Plantactinospora mayteni TaxID=566021 RepID=A0ABQ4EPS6_9ACTN|nr:hypothetical protein [Plantactinospora mayteni]GIG96644.1 hypothetical protein Pma05_32170 [Plantactinospora mayteni]
MIPEEDRGPAWLRDYGGAIEADIQRMEEFAQQLLAEVQKNYVPHMEEVQSDMLPNLPSPHDGFAELVSFFEAHRNVQQDTSTRVWDVGDGTGGLATAAETVSRNYGQADAFSRARVSDVETALDETGAAAAPPPGSQNATAPQGGTENTGSPNA